MPELMRFYDEIEHSGLPGQYYEKFKYRQLCRALFKRAWRVSEMREAIAAVAKTSLFEKFLNAVLNDTTYAYDESFAKIKEMHAIELKKANAQPVDPAEEAKYQSNSSSCIGTLKLAYMNLWILTQLTGMAKDGFENEPFITRTATILNYCFSSLYGPSHHDYQLHDPEKVKFKSIKILRYAVLCCCNLGVRLGDEPGA
jgi:ubiquitin conjugation factor E4 B